MKNEFVPYDIALALKELGFDEECLGIYYPDLTDNLEWVPSNTFNREAFIEKGFMKAPLYQQAFRFFRDRNICFYISSYRMKEGVVWYRYVIERKEYEGFLYEHEAQEACLRKLIEIVKENKDENS